MRVGLNNTTGTLEKCSVGIRILQWHLAHTVRLHNLQRCPHGPNKPNRVFKHKKQT